MKIRNGFVSNSSSSSFVLFGVRIEDHDVTAYQIAKESGLHVICGEEDAYIGLIESGEVEHSIVKDMKDNETRIQFQERIIKSLPEAMRNEAQWYSECWSNR